MPQSGLYGHSRKLVVFMNESEGTLRDFVDRSLRELLSKPREHAGLSGDVVPDLVAGFDFPKMQPTRREVFPGQLASREADLLFEIPYRVPDREEWALVCICWNIKPRPTGGLRSARSFTPCCTGNGNCDNGRS